MPGLETILGLMRWLLWGASVCVGGVGMTYWLMAFSHPAAADAIIHLVAAVALYYASEWTAAA